MYSSTKLDSPLIVELPNYRPLCLALARVLCAVTAFVVVITAPFDLLIVGGLVGGLAALIHISHSDERLLPVSAMRLRMVFTQAGRLDVFVPAESMGAWQAHSHWRLTHWVCLMPVVVFWAEDTCTESRRFYLLRHTIDSQVWRHLRVRARYVWPHWQSNRSDNQ